MRDERTSTAAAESRAQRRLPQTRRRRRLRTVLLLVGAAVWLVLLAAWIAFGPQNTWRDWLAKMKFLPPRSGRSGSHVAHRAEGPADLAYFGRGKAKLGQYSIKIFDPLTQTTLRTDFRLEGQTTCAAEDAFEQFMRNNHHLFREQVMVTLRNCDSADLADPELQLLERKLVSRVNRALGRRFLKSAEIKDFCLYEAVGRSEFVRCEVPDDAAGP